MLRLGLVTLICWCWANDAAAQQSLATSSVTIRNFRSSPVSVYLSGELIAALNSMEEATFNTGAGTEWIARGQDGFLQTGRATPGADTVDIRSANATVTFINRLTYAVWVKRDLETVTLLRPGQQAEFSTWIDHKWSVHRYASYPAVIQVTLRPGPNQVEITSESMR
jgi:hypothetical protein